MTTNEVISSVVDYFSSLSEDTEISTSEALKKTCGFDFDPEGEFLVAGQPVDFHGMFELDHDIRKAARKAGIVIDESLYEGMATGLPFHVPYIVKKQGYFDEYVNEPDPEHWRGFPELMWELGFEMDCYKSAPCLEETTRQEQSKTAIQDRLLSHMAHWTAQEPDPEHSAKDR